MSKMYLAYGSNLDVNQMLRRCPDAVMIGSSVIKNHELRFRGNYRCIGVATIEPKKGSSVPVGIWLISSEDERSLDRYEGYPFLYTKKTLQVPFRGDFLSAMVYTMTKGHDIAPPSSAYLETISTGYDDFGFNKAPLIRAAKKAGWRNDNE